MFSIDTYNNLPSIAKGDKLFHDQLKASGFTLDQLLSELAPLFSEGDNAGRYGIWLLHHHFSLTTGERMVARGDISEPTTDVSSLIVAERWNDEGEELEHRYVDDIDDVPPPPPAEFMKRFKTIIDARKINALGVCYAPNGRDTEKIKEGYIFLESTNHGGRKHVMTVVRADDPRLLSGETNFSASWIPMSGHCCSKSSHRCIQYCNAGEGCKGF
ncbi:hypothetical protein BDZ97DRAFT_811940 [Flammula alnicola]|nr:hypothetical protein BDZ97DRAFT_811940 [Flammula alnicola]